MPPGPAHPPCPRVGGPNFGLNHVFGGQSPFWGLKPCFEAKARLGGPKPVLGSPFGGPLLALPACFENFPTSSLGQGERPKAAPSPLSSWEENSHGFWGSGEAATVWGTPTSETLQPDSCCGPFVTASISLKIPQRLKETGLFFLFFFFSSPPPLSLLPISFFSNLLGLYRSLTYF